MEKQGVEQLKAGVVAVAEIGTHIGDVLEDGRVTVWELPKLAKLASPVEKILALSGAVLIDEISDLTPAEIQELSAAFAAKFNLEADVAELAVEEGVELALRVADLLTDLVKYGKRLGSGTPVPAEA